MPSMATPDSECPSTEDLLSPSGKVKEASTAIFDSSSIFSTISRE
uniref:Uncharacterized protein n=1 Tax=Arundo donax TaxID=35708 RepID=A0A0A9DS50_ARUDO